MEDLLAKERAAEQNVHYLLKNTHEPILSLLQAFEEYRQLCRACIFADFEHGAAKREGGLWHAHTEGKKYFQRALRDLRKQSAEQPVATRQLIKLYLQFIKESQRYYRGYIHQLSSTFGGIPELQTVAHQVKDDGLSESSLPQISSELRKKILDSCHSTLVYLGDLSRYRASEKLDKNPDFGPAIGYYGLACTLRPSSGMGHHQQAVIALEQRQHLRAIYHLYRAMVAEDPHPNAANNLKLEFDKTNAAWDRGELIQRGPPNDPEASKRTLVGWFVRLHSMCYKGEPFRGYEELEREVLGQLAAEVKQRSLDSTLMRMVMINLAAQYHAGEKFQGNPIPENQNAFLHFFRFNIKTFTALLHIFYDDIRKADMGFDEDGDDAQLAKRLTEVGRRVLPALRLYSSWLLTMTHLLSGLSGDDLLRDAIDQLWPIYAKAVDVVAAAFPIWDLEELDEVAYMLEEDADTLRFQPLMNERTNKTWCDKQTGAVKSRFSDRGIERATADDEVLSRVKDFLTDGLFLANDDDDAPIKLRGTRILHRDAEDVEMLPPNAPTRPSAARKAANQEQQPKSAPLSYAVAAANGPSERSAHATMQDGVSSSASNSRDAQLSRMVDDLVDDEDGNNPVTPPQQHSSNPAVVTKGDVTFSALPGSVQDFAQIPNYSYQARQKPIGTGPGVHSPPLTLRTPKTAVNGTPMDRLPSVSNIWNDTPAPQSSTSSHFPAGLLTGTRSSTAQMHSRGHSRVNSASSIRSRTSQGRHSGIGDSWSSIESAPRGTMPNGLPSGVASPLLFGAGGGLWSAGPSAAYRNVTPPTGQGG